MLLLQRGCNGRSTLQKATQRRILDENTIGFRIRVSRTEDSVFDEDRLGVPYQTAAVNGIEIGFHDVPEGHDLVGFKPFETCDVHHLRHEAVRFPTCQVISGHKLLVEVLLKMPMGFRSLLRCNYPTVSKLRKLLSHLLLIMKEIGVNESMIMPVHRSQWLLNND